jgi:polysaccharide biosynthesis PFTS motif protein
MIRRFSLMKVLMTRRIKNGLDRFFIVLNRRVFDQEEVEKKHSQLVTNRFYVDFREVVDKICSDIRREIDNDRIEYFHYQITNRDVALATYQKLVLRTINSLNFKRAIAHALFHDIKIWFPLDKSWQNQLSTLGLRFNGRICDLMYYFLRLATAIKSLSSLFESEIHQLMRHRAPKVGARVEGTFSLEVFLSGFDESNFPDQVFPSHNFFDWLQQRFDVGTQFVHDCEPFAEKGHMVRNLRFQRSIVNSGKLSTIFESYFRLFFLLTRVFVRRSSYFLDFAGLVDEILIVLRIEQQSLESRYKSIFFPSTMLCVKPLWAVAIEKMGVEVVSVHYTAMAEPLGRGVGRVTDGIWHLSNWGNSWVVDSVQVNQMKLTSPHSSLNFSIVGVPYWTGRATIPLPKQSRTYLSAFDTHIRANQVFSAGVLDEMGWNNHELETTFIEIILQVALELDITVLHKRKRRVSVEHINRLEMLRTRLKSEFGNIYLPLDEDISAYSMIEISSLVVSKPISTTAILANQLNVPSIILDPTRNVRADDPGLRKCQLAYDYEDLKVTIKNSLR